MLMTGYVKHEPALANKVKKLDYGEKIHNTELYAQKIFISPGV